eukprot:scaffold97240_cov54-Phaeocystis_antarctica.AAC.1
MPLVITPYVHVHAHAHVQVAKDLGVTPQQALSAGTQGAKLAGALGITPQAALGLGFGLGFGLGLGLGLGQTSRGAGHHPAGRALRSSSAQGRILLKAAALKAASAGATAYGSSTSGSGGAPQRR